MNEIPGPTPPQLESMHLKDNPHRGRFMTAVGLTLLAAGMTCVYPPAAIAAIPLFGWAIYEVRQIPEMNQH